MHPWCCWLQVLVLSEKLWSVGPADTLDPNCSATSTSRPFQTWTSPQIKAAVAAMCVEFGPFLRLSCSYQGLDKLISQAHTSTQLLIGLLKGERWPLDAVFWLNGKTRRARQFSKGIIPKAANVAKIKYVVFRCLKQTRQPWHSWWGEWDAICRLRYNQATRIKKKMPQNVNGL